MAFSNILDPITKPFTGLFSSPPHITVPFSPIPDDVIPLFFSFLDEWGKADLGMVCKTLNATYLKNITSVGLGSRKFCAHLKDAGVRLAEAALEGDLEAHQELDNFYTNYSESLKALNITPSSESSGHFATLANQIIRSSFFKMANINQAKLGTVTQEFNQTLFLALCEFYGKQSLDTITIDNFKAEVEAIRRWFGTLAPIYIETTLRNMIKFGHDSTMFDIIRAELLNPAANAPRFVAIRATMEAKLIAEKNAPETGQERQEAIQASLEPAALDAAARNEATKIANFYRELNLT